MRLNLHRFPVANPAEPPLEDRAEGAR
jgi:hypothetical protein